MSDSTPPKLIKLYKDMYHLTLPECKKSCRVPLSCCSAEYCEFTEQFAKDRGVQLPRTNHPTLPLMGRDGCTAPPHLRPMCTMHTCDIQAMGYKKPRDGEPTIKTDQWNRLYYDLRAEIELEEAKLQGYRIDL